MFKHWSVAAVLVSLLLACVSAQAPAASPTPSRAANGTIPVGNAPAVNGTAPAGNATVPSNTTSSSNTSSVSLGPLATATPVGLVNITALAPGFTQIGSGIVSGPGDGYIASGGNVVGVERKAWIGLGSLVVVVVGGGLTIL